MLPVVALVGRPNVGKSTLFNALTRQRDALVADLEGLTRDRRYGVAELESGAAFVVVDTGGLTGSTDGIAGLTERQVKAAIAESDLLVLMVDARAGLSAEDERIAADLRSTGKPLLLVANKIDGLDEDVAAAEFYALGLGDVVGIAAAHRRGTTQLAETIAQRMPAYPPDADASPAGIRLTIVGRPNVGKSTLINRLLGEERVVAFDQPGTTRDTVEIPWRHQEQDFVLIDTAGIRRRARVDEAVEKFSIIKALKAIQQADVVVVMLDAQDGVVEQDTTLLGHVLDRARPLVIAVNKWDGLDVDQRASVRRDLDRRLSFVPWAEQVFIAARHGSGFGELMAAVDAAYTASRQELSTSRLTRILVDAFEAHQPPMVQGRTAKLRYAHLGGHDPMTIVIHGNRVDTIPASYRRYLANTFRKSLALVGTPLKLEFHQGENPFKGRKNILNKRQLAKRKRLKRFTKRKR